MARDSLSICAVPQFNTKRQPSQFRCKYREKAQLGINKMKQWWRKQKQAQRVEKNNKNSEQQTVTSIDEHTVLHWTDVQSYENS